MAKRILSDAELLRFLEERARKAFANWDELDEHVREHLLTRWKQIGELSEHNKKMFAELQKQRYEVWKGLGEFRRLIKGI